MFCYDWFFYLHRRAVAQRCPEPKMINLISLGGQHQGVFGLPKCSAPKKEWCEIVDKLITHVAYAGYNKYNKTLKIK